MQAPLEIKPYTGEQYLVAMQDVLTRHYSGDAEVVKQKQEHVAKGDWKACAQLDEVDSEKEKGQLARNLLWLIMSDLDYLQTFKEKSPVADRARDLKRLCLDFSQHFEELQEELEKAVDAKRVESPISSSVSVGSAVSSSPDASHASSLTSPTSMPSSKSVLPDEEVGFDFVAVRGVWWGLLPEWIRPNFGLDPLIKP